MDVINWVKRNVTIFLDENIPLKHSINLRHLGYKVDNVYTLNCKSSNDGQILKLLKERKMILVTYDKKFYKMAMRYSGFAILITNPPGNTTRGKSIIKIIKATLHNNIGILEDYYDGKILSC